MGVLALTGGKPVRARPFPRWPLFGELERKGLLEALESGQWFSGYLGADPGSKVEQLERRFAGAHGVRFGVAVANGTAALEVTLRALGVGAGDEVIVPAYTFIATASAVMQVNAIPVIVDIDSRTLCLDPAAAESAVTERTRAMIVVHLGGQIGDMDRLLAVAKRRGLHLVEDAAHAHGSKRFGKYAGAFGAAGTFSFQLSKTMTAGEGGLILTDDETLAEVMRSLRSCGREPGRPGYEHHRLAWNYRMTELQAAILLGQLERLAEQVAKRTANARALSAQLRQIPGLRPVEDAPGTELNGHYLYLVRYDRQAVDGPPRDRILEALRAEGIPCNSGYIPIQRSPLFRRENWEKAGMTFFSRVLGERAPNFDVHTPVAEAVAEEIIELPHRLLLGDEPDLKDIAGAFEKVMTHLDELR